MKTIIAALLLVLATTAQAQITITPASGISGGGVVITPQTLFPDGTAAAPSISFASSPNTGWYLDPSGPNMRFTRSGTFILQLNGLGIDILGSGGIRFGDTVDVQLTRGAANVLTLAAADRLSFGGATANDPALQQNGTTLEVVNATQSAFMVTKAAAFEVVSNGFLGSQAVTAGSIFLDYFGAGSLFIRRSGAAAAWLFNSTSHFQPFADITYDIGLVATRVRNVYAQNFVGSGASLTGIAGATGGISNIVNTNLVADSDNDGSGVIDFTTGVSSKWQITNAGNLVATGANTTLQARDGSAAAPSYSFADNTNSGIFSRDTNVTAFSAATVQVGEFNTLGFVLADKALQFSSGFGAATDVSLSRGAANQLRLADGDQFLVGDGSAAAPSYSFASDSDTGIWRSGANTLSVATGGFDLFSFSTTALTSAMRLRLVNDAVIEFGTGGVTDIVLSRGAANRLDLATGDSLYLVSGGLGVGVTPPATGNITALNTVQSGSFLAASPGAIYWSGRSLMRSPSDGVLTLSNLAETDFNRLQFGGTTSSFPAIGRSSNGIAFRLADNSGYTYIEPSAIYMSGTIGITTGANSPESVVIAPVGSVYLRTGGGAGTTLYIKESGAGNTGWVAK